MSAASTLITEVMTRELYRVQVGTPMYIVLSEMASKRIGSAVVTDEYNQFMGIIDGSKVMDAIAHSNEGDLRSAPVELFMKKQAPRLSAKDTVAEATELMDEHNVHYLVVVDIVNPIGVVSHGDIIRWWVRTYKDDT